ncbi:MAG: metal-dependent transcriptional regulator [Desulfamplus sp.]|nr:metal-dependent transcriptional regulator [Desulfamplus sp.]MBF0389774.1 metal-dependent transcriptional regulator [Desulfamplus sp.]
MVQEKYDEILEAMWTCEENKKFSIDDIKKRCTIDFNDADLEELASMDLIVRNKNKILFSSKGKGLAENIMRRHRLAEVLMSSILKLKNSEMERVACQVEHYLVPEVEESICTLLGHPEICPDGKPIPKGRCCQNRLRQVTNTVVSLNELKPGEQGKITYIKPGDHSTFHQLMSFGLNPGVVVTVHRKSPAFCIKYENTELAIDEKIAENIFVWKMSR